MARVINWKGVTYPVSEADGKSSTDAPLVYKLPDGTSLRVISWIQEGSDMDVIRGNVRMVRIVELTAAEESAGG